MIKESCKLNPGWIGSVMQFDKNGKSGTKAQMKFSLVRFVQNKATYPGN
jgi:hypothetical protein